MAGHRLEVTMPVASPQPLDETEVVVASHAPDEPEVVVVLVVLPLPAAASQYP